MLVGGVVAVALGLMFVAVVWDHPHVGFCAAIPLVVFNDLTVALLGGGPVSSIFGAGKDALLALMLLRAFARGRRLLVGGVDRFVAAMVVVAAASIALTPSLSQGLYGLRNGYLPMLWIIAASRLLGPRGIRAVTRTLVWTGQAAAVVAIVTYTRGIGWLHTLHVLPPPKGQPFPTAFFTAGSTTPRAFSPLGSPNELALVLVAVIAAAWLRRRPLLVRLATVALPTLALVLTRSRSGLLGGVVLVGFFLLRRLSRKGTQRHGLTLAAVGFVLTAVAIYLTRGNPGILSDPSFRGHADSLGETIRQFFAHPLGFGAGTVGPRAIRYTDAPVYTESFVLLIGLETGVLGLVLYLGTVRRIVGRLNGSADHRVVLGVAVLAASAISQVVLPTMQSTSVSPVVWIVVGSSLAAARVERTTASAVT